MHSIETKTFQLSSDQYFKILCVNRLKRFGWLYLAIFAMSALLIPKFGDDKIATFMVIFGFSYPLIVIAQLYSWSRSKKNRNLFMEQNLSFDEEKIRSQLKGDIINDLPWSFVLDYVERKEYWLLYIAKAQFVYIPKSIFKSIEDEKAFKSLLESSASKA